MVNEKVYEVYFVGQDYQPISAAANSMITKCEGKECSIGNFGIINKEEKNYSDDENNTCERARYILNCFLDKIAPNGYLSNSNIIINSSQRNNKKKLYDPNFGSEKSEKGYFCGLVGVVRNTISLRLSELIDSDTNSVEKDSSEEIKLDVTLQIKSRLDVDKDGKKSKPFFLSTMLLRDKVKLSNNTIPSSEDEIFDYLLLFWFKEKLQEAGLKGYYKTYRRFEKNDDRVKGTLDIARHIRLNMGQKNDRIAYSYRENTINNYFNQLIVAAYYHLKRKYYELVSDNFDGNIDLRNFIRFLSDETNYFQASTQTILKNNLKTISHSFFTEYEELRVICLRILRDEGISIFDGEEENDIQGILFYLPELWEKYLEDELLNKAIPDGVILKSQEPVENFGHKKQNIEDYEYKQETYPDYVFVVDNKPFMILDAKCKPKWENAANGGSVSDVMEDYNKCIRDMVATNSHATGVIFPTNTQFESDELNRICYHRISKYNSMDIFYTIPVTVPPVEKDDTYSNWKSKFSKSIQGKIEVINKIISDEVGFAEKNADESIR